MQLYSQIQEAVKTVRAVTKTKPEIAIILGTGLGALAKDIKQAKKIPYSKIPHFPLSTVESHEGMLIMGKLMGKNVVVMQGRFHRYEGYDFKQITFPVRVMKALGAKTLFVFSACGGINRDYYPGDLALLTDHINLMGETPLVGPNDDRLGPRFPDLFNAYDAELRKVAVRVATGLKMPIHCAVYAAMTGPNLETVAEYRFLQVIGADCIGMSTVPEVIVARHAGMKVMGIAVVTDRCVPDQVGPANIREIIRAAMTAEPKLTRLVKKIIHQL
ncbi:purine-nucleoside phosphorylase [bacterium]|nr:purine-nucleoside phosphorylase [bacterium]